MNTTVPKIPGKLIVAALWQWTLVGSVMFVLWLLTYFPMGLLVAYFCKPMINRYGESEATHSQRYIDEGSSGKWLFESTTIPIIELWTNLEDGQRGEPSGKWSAARKGKEATFWSKYCWALRNPVNKWKRQSQFFACFVKDCVIEYWGDKEVSDKTVDGDGAYFIMATSKVTGKKYFGYRKVVHFDKLGWYKLLKTIISKIPYIKKYVSIFDNRVFQPTFGYKIKPTHATETQDADDLDKAFTARVQLWGKIN